jgi:RND family efflux transporter MFP subunit
LRNQARTRQQDLRSRGLGSDAATEEAALALSGAEQGVLARRKTILQAEARVAQAASAQMRAQIALDDAERALRNTAIYAPFDGRVTQVSVGQGARVTPNEMLAEVIDPTALEVMIQLSANQAAQLPDLGAAPTLFTVTVGDQTVGQGIVARAGASVATGESGRVLFGTLQQATGVLPGDFVTVALHAPPLTDVALLPATALGSDGTVLALGPDDRLEIVAVTLLRRQGNDVIIDPGMAAGREVVAERSPLLGAGIKITPIRPGFVTLSDQRRTALIAVVQSSAMPTDEKTRLMEQLAQDQVPVSLIDRLETAAGG